MELKMIDLPENGILLYESKHSDGNVVNEHRHQIHQILYVIDGNGTLKLDGEHSELRPDRLVMIVPNSNHAITAEEKLTILVLAFDEQSLGPVVQSEILSKRFQSSSVLAMNPFIATELRQLLRKMMFEQGSSDSLGAWALRIYLQEILLLLSRQKPHVPITDSNGIRAERMRKYIDEHYFEQVTAGEIASSMGISARYVNNIFKDSYGTTPTQYLTEVRIGVAKKLLSETDKDIVTVCFEVGYENLPTFYRAFRNMVKLSPMKFRKQQQNQL
ncbi:AraC family transcriptional regulator [Paenibacillus cremeus]|uniref:AraC family transcriptional regulator n=1 Tax=Paenibacillus cremeus TaxID=2163881 RepID=A0A559KI61_9BACL|nr:AraC family transcriptional regulator [Paenibacillus cremeus]TVY11812.1 AraC family transcriptional regulator [Paenibacillus cremeus]